MTESIKSLPARAEVPAEMKWDVESVFPNDEAWNQAYNECAEMLKEAGNFSGTLGKSAQRLADFLLYQDDICQKMEKLYLYANMKQDEDNGNPVYQGLVSKIQGLAVNLSAELAFVNPEILAIEPEKLEGWLQEDCLKLYTRYIHEITRMAPHIRNAQEEEILALAGDLTSAPRNIFTMFNNADLKFPVIADENGNKVEITHGNYIVLMQSQDREVRKAAFEGLYSAYEANKNSLAAMMTANIKKDLFQSRVRSYPSVLEAALFGEEIPVKVYEQLIKSVRKNLPAFFEYLQLRKQALGVDRLHMYDIYVPMFNEKETEIPYEKAVETVLQALVPLGEEYICIAKKAFSEGWVDVMENRGKTSGAYSSGVYGTKPFILLNYQNNLDSVFTLAHELGHSMHTYYSSHTQPYVYSDYEIFVAEVASTVNETLLLRYLLDKETDKDRRLRLINYYLDQFRGTVFRQTMFGEFEKIVHEHAEQGGALSCEYYRQVYYQLNKDYFGEDMVIDQAIDMEWSRIPHFYRSFYVYKYATGFTAASALANGILTEGEAAVAKYKEFLSGGCSRSPIDLLKIAGVDMENSATLDKAFAVYRRFIDDLKDLI
ncbi:MAG: oligoendopeptidase F [Bacillota bacterium]|jgi:oligoendopeptidase F